MWSRCRAVWVALFWLGVLPLGAAASTVDLGTVLGNAGFENGLDEWTVTQPNATYLSGSTGENPLVYPGSPAIVPLDPCCSDGTTLPALEAASGSGFGGVRNPSSSSDWKLKLVHDVLSQSFSAGTDFQFQVFANRGRLGTNGNTNSQMPGGSPPLLRVQFFGWTAGAAPTVNSSDDWSRNPSVKITELVGSGTAPNASWQSELLTFSPSSTLALEYISVSFVGLNQNHDQYVAFDSAAIPEPSTAVLLALGLGALARVRVRRG